MFYKCSIIYMQSLVYFCARDCQFQDFVFVFYNSMLFLFKMGNYEYVLYLHK